MGVDKNGIKPLKNFRPNALVTRNEFITIISRMIYDGKNNVSLSSSMHRYEKHITAIEKIKLLSKIPTRITESVTIDIFNYIKNNMDIVDRN